LNENGAVTTDNLHGGGHTGFLVLETCVRFKENLVITDPKKNRWIGSSGQKEDPLDALKLAQLARGGYIKEIHHPLGQQRRFRELMIAYRRNQRAQTG
jgi:hypothetical protein